MQRTVTLGLGLVSSLFVSACIVGSVEDETGTNTAGNPAATSVAVGDLAAQNFCPDALIPRRDMARYLERLKRGRNFSPPAPQNIFSDVPRDSDQAGWIEQLFADRITTGTEPGKFAPDDPVSRQQMAAFLIRLTHSPTFSRGGPSRFTDVDNPDFIGYIEQLFEDGITKGCTPTEFCPLENVPRRQMAAFLMRAAHPGAPDPASSGRFADVPLSDELGGWMEQAVSEGIMEPCGVSVAGVPVVGWGIGGHTELNPAPTLENFLGWIPTTPNYGNYVNDRKKRYSPENDNYHRRSCGGDWGVTTVLDIGEVTHDHVYVRGVRFYTYGEPNIYHQEFVAVGTNGHMHNFYDWELGMDDNGTPWVYYRVEAEFPGGQGRFGDALQLSHVMIPEKSAGSTVGVVKQTGAGAMGQAGLATGISDNPDQGFCSMILRGALPTY